MTEHDVLKARAANTYNSAADAFDAPENSFWDRFGRATVERLQLQPGMTVLDVCAGSGASAIPAARAVGPTGRVVAVDVAEALLALMRAKADRLGLRQLEARYGDVALLDIGDSTFDAVICVFGIFFAADMVQAVRNLWAHVVPGGQLSVTTWGPRLFEPANSIFWDAVRTERPDLYKGFNPWDLITEPDGVRALLASAGVLDVNVDAVPGTHYLPSPDAWWTLVMGSGYRGTVDQLSPESRDRVRLKNLGSVERSGVSEVEANVVYAIARKPAVQR